MPDANTQPGKSMKKKFCDILRWCVLENETTLEIETMVHSQKSILSALPHPLASLNRISQKFIFQSRLCSRTLHLTRNLKPSGGPGTPPRRKVTHHSEIYAHPQLGSDWRERLWPRIPTSDALKPALKHPQAPRAGPKDRAPHLLHYKAAKGSN